MLTIVLKKNDYDHSIYFKWNGQDIIFVALYIDDLILASRSTDILQDTKQAISDQFEIMDMGHLKFSLGMEIDVDMAIIMMSIRQTKLAKSFWARTTWTTSNPSKTGLKLTKARCRGVCKHEETIANVPYRNAVGCLMYLMVGTRPDLADAVGVLSYFAAYQCPTHSHALKRVFINILGAKTHGIEFRASHENGL